MRKNDRYYRIDEKSKTITDILGCGIDEGVRELVVLLNYHNVGTVASCWGHKNHGFPYPWIDISEDHMGTINELISDLDIEVDEFSNQLRIYPKCKTLIKGRRVFNKLKDNLDRQVNISHSSNG